MPLAEFTGGLRHSPMEKRKARSSNDGIALDASEISDYCKEYFWAMISNTQAGFGSPQLLSLTLCSLWDHLTGWIDQPEIRAH